MSTRRKIDAALKVQIALEALSEQATVNDLAQRYKVTRTRFTPGRSSFRIFLERAFDAGIARDADAAAARGIGKLHAKIGQPTIENDFFAKRLGK